MSVALAADPFSVGAAFISPKQEGGCMALFDGLYLYQIAILVCGCLLFLALLVALLWKVFSNQDYKGLLTFFLIPIVMIGFPAFSSFELKTDLGDLEVQTTNLQSKPQDQQARTALQANVANIESRPFNDPTVLATIARAQYALGDENKAQTNLNKALAAAPTLVPAVELKNKIELATHLQEAISTTQSQPDNPKAREELQSTYTKLSQLQVANPKLISTMSRAKAVLEKH
jgi:hypothetical protein